MPQVYIYEVKWTIKDTNETRKKWHELINNLRTRQIMYKKKMDV